VLSGVPEILTAQELWQSTLRICSVGVVTVVAAVALGIGISHFSVRF